MTTHMSTPELISLFYNREKVPGPEPQEKQTFAARCHCGNIQFTVTLATSILPLNAYICSCTFCRYSHGTFGSFHISLPQGVAPEWTNNAINVTAYKTPDSGAGGHGQRLFCPTCGAHNGHYEPWAGQWVTDVTLFDGPPFWKFIGFGFPKSPGDGGLLSWLPSVGGEELITLTLDHDRAPDYKLEVTAEGEERLRAECLCGGVSFTIPRPSVAAAAAASKELSRYVSPLDTNKWKAFLDFSRDSQRLSSAHMMPWIQVPRTVLKPEVPVHLNIGTMKTYKPPEKDTWGFCGRCGATVFHQIKNESSEVLNVSMGILRAPEGAKAENWVTWRADKPESTEKAMRYDPEFVSAIVEGHNKWALEKYGDAPGFD